METSLRHSEKALRAALNRDEAEELYAALRYFGKTTVEDAVFNMFHRGETPLENFWQSYDEFALEYFLLRKVARALALEQFITALDQRLEIPELELSFVEKRILTDLPLLHRSCHRLYFFFASMPAYFDYEVALMELGYPIEPAA